MIIGAPLGLITEGYQARAVTFDGTNDYMKRGADFTGNADGKVGVFSCWIKSNSDIGTKTLFDNGRCLIKIEPTGFIIELRNSGGTRAYLANTATDTLAVSEGWVHVLCSWDVLTGVAYIYLDDVESTAGTPLISNLTIDYTRPDHTLGAEGSTAFKLNADIADFYFNNQEYIDLSVEANRRKFISGSGKPVFLGDNGELPTGTSPRLFLSLAQGAAVSTFATNKGTGGGMTITGTLAEAATSPSD